MEFVHSLGLGGAVNQQRSLLGWRKGAVGLWPAWTRLWLTIAQLKPSTGCAANPRTGWGAGNRVRAVRALQGGCTEPAAFHQALHFLHCCCSVPQLSTSSWAAAVPERTVQPQVWIYFSPQNLQEERALNSFLVCWGLSFLPVGSVIPQRWADLYTRYVQDKLGPRQWKRPDVCSFKS